MSEKTATAAPAAAPAARVRLWALDARTVVYAAVGAALYGVLGSFQIPLAGTGGIALRPAQAITAFIGYRFGPLAGFFTGFVGNAIIDQISGYGFITYWWWHLANGLVGFIAGLIGWWFRRKETAEQATKPGPQAVKVAVAGLVAILFAYLVTVIGIVFDRSTVDVWFVTLYIPVIIGAGIVTVILAPAIDRIWQPIANRAGR